MSEEIKQVSHQLGALAAITSNLEKQLTLANQKLDCVHQQTIVTNESVKSAHKRQDTMEDSLSSLKEDQDDIKKIVDRHENLKWAAVGIFGFVSFSLGLLGTFAKYVFAGAPTP